MLTYFLCWFPMLLIAVINGSLRNFGYKRFTNELRAHQVSTVTLLLLLICYFAIVFYYFPLATRTQAFLTGLLWMMLTLAFEFGTGLLRGRSFLKLLEDYNLLKGRLWVLIPVWLLTGPVIFYRLGTP